WVMGTAAALALVEFATDKIPRVHSVWALLQTPARSPAGAVLAAATLSDDGQLGTGALVLGGTAALGMHLLKSGTRAAINSSPEPVSNWVASTGEDITALGVLALVFAHPWLALGLLLLVMLTGAAIVWLVMRWLWRLARPRSGVAAG